MKVCCFYLFIYLLLLSFFYFKILIKTKKKYNSFFRHRGGRETKNSSLGRVKIRLINVPEVKIPPYIRYIGRKLFLYVFVLVFLVGGRS